MYLLYVNLSTQEAEANKSLNLRSAWSTEWVPRQPELHLVKPCLEKSIIKIKIIIKYIFVWLIIIVILLWGITSVFSIVDSVNNLYFPQNTFCDDAVISVTAPSVRSYSLTWGLGDIHLDSAILICCVMFPSCSRFLLCGARSTTLGLWMFPCLMCTFMN